MRATALVLVAIAVAVWVATLPVGDIPSPTAPDPGPTPRAAVLTAEKPAFTRCEDVVILLHNPGPTNVSFPYPPGLLVFTAGGDPVDMGPLIFLTVIWGIGPGSTEPFPWDQTYFITDLHGNEVPPTGEKVPSGDYYATLSPDSFDGPVGPAPFSIVPCGSTLDAGADVLIDEGTTQALHLDALLAPDQTLLSVSWDVDATVDSDGNGNQTDDADAVGQATNVTFGDDGVFDVTANARVAGLGTNTSKADQDVIFMIDSSGSMQWNDPSNDRLTAAKAYVDLLAPDDRAAVIDFDDNEFLVPGVDSVNPGDHLSANYAKVKTNIDEVDSVGGTAFLPAFMTLNKEFKAKGDATHAWVAIFLTDAQSIHFQDRFRLPTVLNETAALGIRVFPVGLAVPEELDAFMEDVANRTGGTYFPSLTGADLLGIYEEISRAVESNVSEITLLSDTMRVTVANVAPSLAVAAESVVESGLVLRIAGEEFHDVTATVLRNGTAVSGGIILRMPGSPDEQLLDLVLAMAGDIVEVVYTPLDDPVNGRVWGATPAWLILAPGG